MTRAINNTRRLRGAATQALGRVLDSWEFPDTQKSRRFLRALLNGPQNFGDPEKTLDYAIRACLRVSGDNWLKSVPLKDFPQHGIEFQTKRLEQYRHDFRPVILEMVKVFADLGLILTAKRGRQRKFKTIEDEKQFVAAVRECMKKKSHKECIIEHAAKFEASYETGCRIFKKYKGKTV